MKTRNHVAYSVPLTILLLILVAALLAPPEPTNLRLCKQYSQCVVAIPSFSGWPGLR